MNAEELAQACLAEKPGPKYPSNLRDANYREHYPVIRDAVTEHNACLRTAIRLYRDTYKEKNDGADPWPGKSIESVYMAYYRAIETYKKEKVEKKKNKKK